MAKKVGKFAVHVVDDKGEGCWLMPGETYPAWAEKQVDNPLAFEGTTEVPDELKLKVVKPVPVPGIGGGIGVSEGPPPQSGAGSSRQAWAEYAAANGVEVGDDDKRDDIIAACEDAGVPVE